SITSGSRATSLQHTPSPRMKNVQKAGELLVGVALDLFFSRKRSMAGLFCKLAHSALVVIGKPKLEQCPCSHWRRLFARLNYAIPNGGTYAKSLFFHHVVTPEPYRQIL